MTTSTANTTLDARGLNCPLPILRTRKTLAEMETGEILNVISSDPASVRDIASFCQQTGNTLLESSEDADRFEFLIRKI